MATPGSMWGALANQMLNNREGYRQGQERIDIDKQQENRAQQEATWKTVQHAMEMGALPVVGGMVKRTMYNAGNPDLGVGPTNGTLLDKADPTRTVKWGTGPDEISLELPTEQDQRDKHVYQQFADALNPARRQTMQIQNQNQEQANASSARGTSRGMAEGKATADAENLTKNGMDLSDEDAVRLGLPKGSRILRTEATNLAGKIKPAEVRTQGAFDRTKYRTDLQTQTQQTIADRKAEQEAEKLKMQQAWNDTRANLMGQQEAGRNNRAANTQAGLNNRNKARIGVDEKLHGQWLNQAFDEEQKQLQATALLGETEEPGMMNGLFGKNTVRAVEDGQEFTDPWTGKKATMNMFQRQRIKNALGTSQRKHDDLKQRADEIANRYGLNGGQPSTPDQNAQPASAPPGGGRPAVAAAAPRRSGSNSEMVRIITGDGKSGLIPRANLERARKLDSRIQVITGQ